MFANRPSWLKVVIRIIAGLLVLVLVMSAFVYFSLRASLPKLDGEVSMAKLSQAVTVSRDLRGTATIGAANLTDAMRSLGFIHAQERFFEMDLARRSAAGELSALLGKATISMDKEKRVHRFRHRMESRWQTLPAADASGASLLTAYTEGVNAGLAALNAKPWQYSLLQAPPQPWTEVDSLLVMCEMLYMLQAKPIDDAYKNAVLREKLSTPLFAWMRPLGGTWDAAFDGSVIPPVPMPGADQINVRNNVRNNVSNPPSKNNAITTASHDAEHLFVGSNAWSIGGALTTHGSAMLANDMHLGHSVPNIWFRAQIEITDSNNVMTRLVGVTLPGLPALVVGSNGNIAWGFTNSYGKWFDWVPLPATEEATLQIETIQVKGGDAIKLAVRESRFGPVLKVRNKQRYALNWLGHRSEAINLNLSKMAMAKTVDEALPLAQLSGGPHQNIFIVDKAGHNAWTIMGKMAIRSTHATSPNSGIRAGFAAIDALDGDWLPTTQYPAIKDPADHRLWSGNNRQLSGAGGGLIGEGGFDLGARGQQIRDRLREKDKFDEVALHNIGLDTEARFLKRWAQKASDAAEANRALNQTAPNALAAIKALKSWNGHADVDQAGYWIAQSFRLKVLDALWASWIAATPAARASPDINSNSESDSAQGDPEMDWDHRFEYAAWQAISSEAPHLLPLHYTTWNAFLSAKLGDATTQLLATNASLAEATWGKRNTTKITHPIARAVPQLGYFLNMPAAQLSGDNHMPKVAAPSFGASERLVVAPGHEEAAIMTMPGGQSGHPLSPFYGAGHQDWVEGKPAPLLAGEAKYRLVLRGVEGK